MLQLAALANLRILFMLLRQIPGHGRVRKLASESHLKPLSQRIAAPSSVIVSESLAIIQNSSLHAFQVFPVSIKSSSVSPVDSPWRKMRP